MDGEQENNEIRKNSSIGALLSGVRQNPDSRDGGEPEPPPAPKPKKSSLIDDLKNMDQGFDFSSMGTMGDFSGWGFGNVEDNPKPDEDDGDDDNWGRNNRRGGRDGGGRGRDGGGRGRDGGRGGRGDRGGRDNDSRGGRGRRGMGRTPGGRDGGRDRGNRRDSFNNDGWRQDDDNDNDDGGWKKPSRDRNSGNDRNAKKPGDWTCRDCGFDNFASRSQCFKCNSDKGGDQRKSSFGGRGNNNSMSGANASYLGKRNRQDDDEPDVEPEPEPEPEKRSRLDEDIYGPPMITSWTDIKEYDDDHDAQMFSEENEYLVQRYGEGVVRVRYTNQGVVGYFCMICEVEMTGEKPLELHCNGMKHLKKKERKENPVEDQGPMQKDKKGGGGGGGSRPRLLPPEAFGRDDPDQDRDRSRDRDRGNRNRNRFDDNSFDRGGRGGSMGRNRDGGNWNQGNNRNSFGRGGSNRDGNFEGGRSRNDWRDQGNDRQGGGFRGRGGGAGGGGDGPGGAGLTGGPTGTLLTKLADCSVKSEGDAELATNVIGLLLKSLKDYSMKKGESKVAELLLQAELKMSTVKALKVGLQYLSGSQGGNQPFGSGGGLSMGGMRDSPMGGNMMGGGMGGPMGGGMGMGGGMMGSFGR